MKICLATFVGIMLLVVSGCGGSGGTLTTPGATPIASPSPTPVLSQSQWTWVAGSNLPNGVASYGTLGVPSAQNTPGARVAGPTWTDKSGNFWLFGGQVHDSPLSFLQLSDLWRLSGGQWTWMGGPNSVTNLPGVYGTLGVAAPGNTPGGRILGASWRDAVGNLWLFSGFGRDANDVNNLLNDLWKFDGSQWAWMGGSNLVVTSQPGIYGTKGVASSSNFPGGRTSSTYWNDASGNFWMFGGAGLDSTGAMGSLNDLWEFNAGQWTWISGSNLVNQSGVYGVKGTSAPGNAPGGRSGAMNWVDPSGSFWIYGGRGVAGDFDDLWKFSAGQWTWISGENVPTQQPAIYGTLGVPAPGNTPGIRFAGNTWTDVAGDLWLFSGSGVSDLWKFGGGQWTWVGGTNVASTGAYGTQGTPSSSNIPWARTRALSWQDASGNVWIFGGENAVNVTDPLLNTFDFNDLWKLQPR